MEEPAEVGRFGTIRLMKKHDPNAYVASFPIDDETVSFGRNPDCSVRLYYDWVSAIHCKIVFKERKAFLQVLGSNGVMVDGCHLFPAKPSASGPTTVPLINGSTIEIFKKRFQFTYPPKELRSHLFEAPVAHRRRSRLSMIQSSQVFSSSPSKNPQENLRVLQSPLSRGAGMDTVKLVDGDCPKVVEEQEDLIILEDVPAAAVIDSPRTGRSPIKQQPIVGQYNTPTRRRSALSLHRAVLIRSAQRAAVRQETLINSQRNEENDEMEEEEVEEAVSAELIDVDLDDEHESEQDITEAYAQDMDGEEHEEVEDYDDDVVCVEPSEGSDNSEVADAENEDLFPLIYHPEPMTDGPVRRQLGAFMTPQPSSRTLPTIPSSSGPQRPPPGSRFSLGFPSHMGNGRGGGAQRVRVMGQPWKITDIVVPVVVKAERNEGSNGVKEEVEENISLSKTGRASSPMKSPVKVEISEEEKRAIRERRKSALTMPDPTLSHVPGTRRTSVLPSSPIKKFSFGTTVLLDSDPVASSNKTATLDNSTNIPNVHSIIKKEEDQEDNEEMDAKTMLERMKETIDGMRKRQSLSLATGVLSWASVAARGSRSPSPGKKAFSLYAEPSPSPMNARLNNNWGGIGRGAGFGRGGPENVVLEETFSQVRRAEQEEEDEVPECEDGSSVEGSENESEGETKEDAIEMDEEQEQDSESEAELEKENASLQPSRVPQTPRMDGLRDLYKLPRPTPATPSFTGMRDMFQEPRHQASSTAEAKIPENQSVRKMHMEGGKKDPMPMQTPEMRGMKGLFAKPKAMGTPNFEGLGDMLRSPVRSSSSDLEKDNEQMNEEDIVDADMDHEDIAPTRIQAVPKTASRRKVGRPPVSERNTPTDSTDLADDEATPGIGTVTRRGTRKAGAAKDKGIPEDAVVRRGRSRKVVAIGSEVEEIVSGTSEIDLGAGINEQTDIEKPAKVKTAARKTKSTRARSEDVPAIQRETHSAAQVIRPDELIESEVQFIPTKPKRKTRVKTEPAESDAEHLTQEDGETTKAGRRGKRTEKVPITSRIAATTSKAPTSVKKGTRGRSKSIDVNAESVDDPLDSISRPVSPDVVVVSNPGKSAKGGRSRVVIVDTIMEEEEQQPSTGKKTKARPRARSIKMEVEENGTAALDSGSEVPLKKAAGGRKATTTTRQRKAVIPIDVESQDDDDGVNKENVTTDAEQMGTSAKSVKVTKSRAAVKTDDENMPAQRITRARTRK